MIRFSDITLRRGANVLLEKVDFTLFPGQNMGIVGRNGTGKSSLLAMMLNQLSPDQGEITTPKSLDIAHVRQEIPTGDIPALNYVMAGDRELVEMQTRLEADPADMAAHEAMAVIDGYRAEARAGRLLAGLGFAGDEHMRAVEEFSGGWRMRLNLAQALMRRSDLLLLDEPTNHLDLEAVLWLQEWLRQYPGSVMVVSHDRDFLDATTDLTLNLARGGAQLYTGGYTAFESQRAERARQEMAQHESQMRKASELQQFIDRFRAKASKAKQAQSRVKQLERLELNAPAHWDSPFKFRFATPKRLPNPVIQTRDLAIGYGDDHVLSDVNLTLEPGQRVGLLGPNGIGKSTLLKCLAGLNEPAAGELLPSPHLIAGYFAQHQVDQVRPDATPLALMKEIDPGAGETALRSFLGGFNFSNDRTLSPVGQFSGGEKARLTLAMIVYRKPNLLLLDEPTNHLDMEMRHSLEVALADYEGAAVIISHDRHLLASACDELWLINAGDVQPFDGDLDDYGLWLKTADAEAERSGSEAGKSGGTAKQRRQEAARARAAVKPLRSRVKKAEKAMAEYERSLRKIDADMLDPAVYDQPEEATRLAVERGEVANRLAEAEADWLAAAEELEALQD